MDGCLGWYSLEPIDGVHLNVEKYSTEFGNSAIDEKSLPGHEYRYNKEKHHIFIRAIEW